jgi:hypothetical protein
VPRLLKARRLSLPRLLAAAAAVLALGAGSGLAVADAVGVAIQPLGLNVPVPADKTAAIERLVSVATTDSSTERVGAPGFEPQPIPARMLESDAPVPIPPSVLQERNGWLVSDGRTLVAVYAGAEGADSAVGRLVIVRQDLVAGAQTVRVVDAGSTGPLTISAAPLGTLVETSAQTGSLRLRTPGGQLLGLDLRSDKVLQDAHGTSLP